MNINDLRHIYFIGAGGIGMSALARYFNTKGIKVSGYDKTETDLTKKLVSEGIEIQYVDDVALIPEDIELVIYTPAVSTKHRQLKSLQMRGAVPVMKRSQVLGIISEQNDSVAVAGTHGKTSTTAILSHVMKYCGIDVSAFIGGILSDYNTNYFAGSSNWVVLEADEFDKSFLTLRPEIAILQSMDADHLDVYGDDKSVRDSFVAFLNKTEFGGKLVINYDLVCQFTKEEWDELKMYYKVITYGTSSEANAVISEMNVEDDMSTFMLLYNGENTKVSQYLPGMHNRMNATAAIIASVEAGCDMQKAAKSLSIFKGIKRRFEFVVRRDVIYIDDYAHHPTELNAAISAARELFPKKKILGIFQPHLYSRTKDFANGFAQALDTLDDVILMDIYPAREEPIKGVDSNLILSKMNNKQKSILDTNEILNIIKEKNYDVVMTLGAGDIDLLVPKIKDILIH